MFFVKITKIFFIYYNVWCTIKVTCKYGGVFIMQSESNKYEEGIALKSVIIGNGNKTAIEVEVGVNALNNQTDTFKYDSSAKTYIKIRFIGDADITVSGVKRGNDYEFKLCSIGEDNFRNIIDSFEYISNSLKSQSKSTLKNK